jgi:hypothetical protein
VARDAAESRCLARDARNAGGALVVVEAEGVPGAVVVVELDRPACDEGVRARAASLAVRYSRSREETVAAALWTQGTERIRMTVAPASETDLEAWRI